MPQNHSKFSPSSFGRGVILVGIICLTSVLQCLAFGELGHRVIGAMAQDLLSPKTKVEIATILAGVSGGGPTPNLSEIAIWADKVRSLRPETRSWHYVTIQINEPSYNPALADTPNVVTALERQLALLHRPVKDQNDRYVREEALKWVVHLLGDFHQPLHVGEDHDRGGNLVKVKINRRTYKLHEVWDDVLLERMHLEVDDLHALLAKEIKADAGFLPRNSKGTLLDWVNETHAKSKSCYLLHGKIMRKGIKLSLDEAYVKAATLQVREQLKIASVRLALVLNRALDPSGTTTQRHERFPPQAPVQTASPKTKRVGFK
jgi:hypothetical protein